MQKHTSFSLALILSAGLLAGCEGNGPNTQNGAVTGGAIGALAGAIIGNNSGSHNGLAGALIGGTVGAIAGGTIGNTVDHENGTVYGSEREAATTVVVQSPPQTPGAPQDEAYMPPPPTPDAVWINGYWAWDGSRYIWAAGHWIIPPPGYRAYIPPHWAYRQDGAYIYIRGYWRR